MPASSPPGQHGGEVLPFDPARRNRPDIIHPGDIAPTGEVAPVLQGRVVDKPPLTAVIPRYAVTVIRVVAAPENARHVRRHGGYVATGMAVMYKRWRDSSTSARYSRFMAMAEAVGDHDKALEWEGRLAAFRRDRHQRRMDWLTTPVRVIAMLPKIAGGGLAVLAGTGILLAVAHHGDLAWIAVPFEILARVTAAVFVVASVSWGPALLAAPWIALAALWHAGRRHALGAGPAGWAATASDGDVDIQIDETTVARALQALNIKQINDYLRQGLPLQFIVPCRVDGRGTHFVIRLPAGVPAERIARRRADVASGLYRQAKEVWLSTGAEAGILDGWIADKGALAEGAGPYPLLAAGFADVFKGVPFGRTLRGDPITAPLAERNTITGGMPGQGKSSAARVIMAGAALDITAELRIWVPDTNFDFEAFRPRCSRYEMGADDDTIRRIRDDLRELRAEVQARGQLLIDHGVPAVTRELASAGVGLHPVIGLLEEAHVAIQHQEYGKEIAGLLIDIVKLGRKRAIHLIVSTQAPTKDSMPRDVTRNCSNGIAFAVGDHVANDALLGQGAYAAGHRATELIPGTDRGTALVKGFSGERSQMVQVHYLDVTQGASDQVTPIISRALAEMTRKGRPVPGTGRARTVAESRDLLADLDTVLADRDAGDRVRLADIPALLRDLAPAWPAYKAITGNALRDLLEDAGIRVTNTGNVYRLDPADLRHAITQRDSDWDELARPPLPETPPQAPIRPPG